MSWHWQCDYCGGNSAYSAQGMREVCNSCGHSDGSYSEAPFVFAGWAESAEGTDETLGDTIRAAWKKRSSSAS
jgi:hypothetical protein